MHESPPTVGRVDVVTFDCYGTLIDWEAGIRNAFRKAMALGRAPQENRIFELYEEEERRIEKQQYRPYREVLSQSMLAAAKRAGWEMSEEQSRFLARDLPNWEPYPDTNPALKRLATRYELGILSNIDDDLLVGTLKHLQVPFRIVVTAEGVRSYKPGTAHFQQARRIIGDRGWLHVAGSLYHDIEPARSLGVRGVWVNRAGLASESGALQPGVWEVEGLDMLADLLQV